MAETDESPVSGRRFYRVRVLRERGPGKSRVGIVLRGGTPLALAGEDARATGGLRVEVRRRLRFGWTRDSIGLDETNESCDAIVFDMFGVSDVPV